MGCKEILFSDHAITQMFKRSISVDDVKRISKTGEVVRSYLNDRPFPSRLLLGYIDKRPIHVLIGKDAERCIIITAYEPDPHIWNAGFKSKRN